MSHDVDDLVTMQLKQSRLDCLNHSKELLVRSYGHEVLLVGFGVELNLL